MSLLFDFLDFVSVEGQDPEVFVSVQAVDGGNIIIVQIDIFEVLVGMYILYAHDTITRVITPLQIRGWRKIQHEFNLVVRCIQLNQMTDVTQFRERCQLVS